MSATRGQHIEICDSPYASGADNLTHKLSHSAPLHLMTSRVVGFQTISSSRHVGPIRSRVEDWEKRLDLFAKTLVSPYLAPYAYLYMFIVILKPGHSRHPNPTCPEHCLLPAAAYAVWP